MNRQMITATNTLGQIQKQMDILSNNMANLQTNGYKKREAYFSDMLFQQFDNQPTEKDEVEQGQSKRRTPLQIRQGTGARLGQAEMNMSQGALKATDRPLDIAFTKADQFLKVLVQDDKGSKVQFTRDGALQLSPVSGSETMLVNSDGRPVLDEKEQPIIINGSVKDTKFTENGEFIVHLDSGQTESFQLGVISVKKPQFLEQKGNNLVGLPENMNSLGVKANDIYTDMTGNNRGSIAIQQGSLEQSNVDLSKEMSQLISLQRSYQFQARAITMADQMMGLVNGIR
ncbi:flagellar hook-basal body protein [Falsibacillus albus]|uniref:Flagellar hook-basal body protein n=1 Tax=Falsibacillus albus TaxID=2478915 RepID=A0A3L7JW62_9BACI|nr:flagellar hook-basal body protein [Falsibacillus albus]RLQ94760.1 flagellar hook-basal body protein [Falsibacillus albus]